MKLRYMNEGDRKKVFLMMREFYHSPALLHPASDEILQRDIEDCIGDCPFVEGFVIEVDSNVAGYAIISKSYSTEYACPCIWIEDLYFKADYRGKGLGTAFFEELENVYCALPLRLRLEVEPKNQAAIALYEKMGFKMLPYKEMTKEL